MKKIISLSLFIIGLICLLGGCQKSSTYTVTFDPAGGTLTSATTVKVKEGALVSEPIVEREGYVFKGWYQDNILYDFQTPVMSDVTLTAVWLDQNISYTVTFLNINDNVINTQSVKAGESAVAPADPILLGKTFKGWDTDFSAVYCDLTIRPLYEAIVYTVTFKDDTGNTLSEQKVDWGEDAVAPETPVYSDKLFVYWDQDYTHITRDCVVTAVYSSTIWTITYLAQDGKTVLDYKKVGDGGNGNDDSIAPVITGYTFSGWSEDLSEVYSDMTVTATYKRQSFTVTFYDINNDVISYTTVLYGNNAIAPQAPYVTGKSFSGWDKSYKNVTSNLDVYAQYKTSMLNVTFYGFDNVLLGNVQVEYDGTVVAPEIPEVDGYEFVKFDHSLEHITTNQTIHALYKIATFIVTFYCDNQKVEDQIVEWGYDAVAPEPLIIEGYCFDHWDQDFTNVKSHLKVNGVYVESVSVNVTFKGNGALVKGQEAYTTSIKTGTIIKITPSTDTTKIFIGWFSGDKKVTYVSESCTLTARYSDATLTDDEAIQTTLNSLSLPSSTYENITLPTFDEATGCILTWTSSGTHYLAIDGIIYPSLTEAHTVTLTAKVERGESSAQYSTQVTVLRGYNTLPIEGVRAAYTYGGIDELNDEVMNGIDIFYMSFDSIDASGNVSAVRTAALGKDRIKQAHAQGCRVVASFQNKTNFSKIAASTELTNNMVKSCIALLEEWDIDGIDIDWEFPNSGETTNYTKMMKALYTGIKAVNPNYLVTSAIGGGPWQPNYFDLKNSAQYHDYINMMTYDMQTTARASFQNALYYNSSMSGAYLTQTCTIDATVSLYVSLGVKLNQIMIGIPFYGRYFYDTHTLGGSCSSVTSITYSGIKSNYLSRIGNGVTEYYSKEAGCTYLIDTTNNVFISYDSPASIAQKAAYVHTKGLAGIMWWQQGQDSSTHDLLNAVKENLKRVYA